MLKNNIKIYLIWDIDSSYYINYRILELQCNDFFLYKQYTETEMKIVIEHSKKTVLFFAGGMFLSFVGWSYPPAIPITIVASLALSYSSFEFMVTLVHLIEWYYSFK